MPLNDVIQVCGLSAYGYFNLQSKPQLQILSNLAVDNFSYLNQIKLKKLRLQGQLPTSEQIPSLLTAQIENLSRGKRQIDQAELRLAGTRRAQVLSVKGRNQLSQFYVEVAGGFRGNQWLGLLQKGDLNSKRIHLIQQDAAPVIYNSAAKSVYVGAHCWLASSTQICLDKPLQASPAQANMSLLTQNMELGDFAAFMPEGLAVSGKLNGYARASWQKGSIPQRCEI